MTIPAEHKALEDSLVLWLHREQTSLAFVFPSGQDGGRQAARSCSHWWCWWHVQEGHFCNMTQAVIRGSEIVQQLLDFLTEVHHLPCPRTGMCPHAPHLSLLQVLGSHCWNSGLL